MTFVMKLLNLMLVHPSEDQVYDVSTEMSSFLPLGEQQQQELDAVRDQLSAEEPMSWPRVEIC